ncbi:ROK family protein [Nocardioides marmoriginsengisoli]|uniref:ROK family protein n=1 Tax=Nocardioides marmoriginsengisoli TaxID=661483 RepID=A0A3N0CFD0_9ACTN|nr:ROK family protein [Nocardioides marmoriginsengisoli]RNL62148.1 ROK family protein [Nocardioides marmoriginsengisoli]
MSPAPATPWRAGFDVGGTQVKHVAVDARGEVLHQEILPTGDLTLDGLPELLAGLIATTGERLGGPPVGVGIAMPGILGLTAGPVAVLGRFGGGIPDGLAPSVRSAVGVPVVFLNDADAFGIAEHRSGAGTGVDRLLVITLGTGVGGCVLVGGRLLGDLGSGEGVYLGHTVVDPRGPVCGCGQTGCAEVVLSATALLRRAREALGEVPATADLPALFAAARAGDAGLAPVLAAFGADLARFVLQLVHATAAQRVVLGGGVLLGADLFLDDVAATVARLQVRAPANPVTPVVVAALPEIAGALGAGLLAGPGSETS